MVGSGDKVTDGMQQFDIARQLDQQLEETG